jgi:elongator complex protein 3
MQQKRLDFDKNKGVLVNLLNEVYENSPKSTKELDKICKKYLSIEGEVFSKSFLTTSLRELEKLNLISKDKVSYILPFIKMKETRTVSGVTPVTVLTKPFPCPGKCIFCPNDVRMPKSYLSDEPGAQRALSNKFDPYLQSFNRLLAFKNTGHPTSKIELLILGGTWSSYPEEYQIWFVKRCFDALNDFEDYENDEMLFDEKLEQPFEENKLEEIDGSVFSKTYNQVVSNAIKNTKNILKETATWEELFKAHQKNEKSQTKCVGLSIETRPDEINEEEVIKLRKLGSTKVQIGIQSLNDEVLKMNKRGHDVKQTINAVSLLRRAGFKIHAHYMPNLYGSNPNKDCDDFLKLFSIKDISPDELKIYPCSLIKTAELMQVYEKNLWKPYTSYELSEVLEFCILNTPRFCRLTRIIRDIPSTDIVVGNKLTNFRQIAENKIRESDKRPVEIRSREVKNKSFKTLKSNLKETFYETLYSTEYFIEYVGEEDEIFGFLRLSLPKISSFIQEISSCALVREVHVYGRSTKVGEKDIENTQHQGLGKKLLKRAEEISLNNSFDKLAVISAIGTREYYLKNGFVLNNLYQLKDLK